MLQEFLQRLMSGGAPVQPMPNRLGLAPDMLEGPGAAGPGMLAYHNALSSMSAPAQQAQPFALDAQGFPPAPAPYAAPQASMPQQAPMQSQQPLSRSGVSEAPSGGGIGSFLGNIFNPGAAGRNQTVQWLQSQGMDEGTATLMAGNKNALQSYLLDRTKGADPKAALELAKLQLEVGNLANPRLSPAEEERLRLDRERFGFEQEQAGVTPDIKNYQFYADAERAAGREPLGPLEWEKAQRAAGATSISNVVGDGSPGLGKLSTDYGYVLGPDGKPRIDPNTGLPMAAPVPGSPAARELEQGARQAETRNTQTANSASVVLQDIDRAIEQVSGWTAGPGSALSVVPGSSARDLSASLDTVKANIGFDRLQQMREASPTGGALGGIAVQELMMLQAVLGSLDQAQSPSQLAANLRRLKEIYEPIARKAAAYPNAAEYGFSTPSLSSSRQPVTIDGYTIEQVD
ncbi:hypothetical protein [Microcystis phage Mae-JY35]